MARSTTIRKITQKSNGWLIRFGKSEVEITGGTKADLRDWIKAQISESDELLIALALAVTLKADNTLNNLQSLVGKTLTLDLSGNVSSDGIVRVA